MKQFLPLVLGLTAAYSLADVTDITTMAQASEHTTEPELAQSDMPVDEFVETSANGQDEIALNFDPPQSKSVADSTRSPAASPSRPIETKEQAASASSRPADPSHKDLFAGGSESIVARTVGAAEGTRSPNGSKTDIYEGHVDPGNGVWNRGTFSYQFGNEENLTAEEADRRQMAKIKRIYESVMLPKAEKHGVAPLTLAEELNGIDLINQAPLAVTEDGGYIERLAEAKTKKGLSGQEAILEARIWSFWDPSRDGWDAPGLRAYDDMGKEASIRHDQKRRMGMIDEALTAYGQTHGAIAERSHSTPSPSSTATSSEVATRVAEQTETNQLPTPDLQQVAEQRADLIIFGSSQAKSGTVALALP